MNRSIVLILCLFLFPFCSPKDTNENKFFDESINQPEYAQGFAIIDKGDYKEVIVRKAFKNAKNEYRYALVSDYKLNPDGYDEVVKIPVARIVSTSTTHLPFLEMLGVEKTLIGFPGTDYISTPSISKRVRNNQIRELGNEKELNVELIIEADPDLVLGYLLSGDFGALGKVKQSGIPVILNAEYLEESPLGKAEWIKFVAAFYNLEDKADSIFEYIKGNYLKVKELTAHIDEKPTVFSGVMYGDVWFMPGGNSWASKFFSDGGADFLWKENELTGSIELSYESVYDKAHKVTFWIGAASFLNLTEMAKTDQRYTNFDAFRNQKVFTYTKRINGLGGNDFFETGSARPDIILSDMVKILHPDLLPDYELYFYEQLK